MSLFNYRPDPVPRASRIPVSAARQFPTELWMGGADSLHGELVTPEDLRDAWVVDLAGDMPAAHREACACWLPRVFVDVEQVPHGYERLTSLAESIAACITGAERDDGWPHPSEPPRRLYVMCQQGMNRSGLLAGLILRALGVPAEDAIAAIATRPGALTNQTFARLIREWGVVSDE
jgi:hypothetical protein